MEHEGAVEHCGAREWLDQSSNSKQQSNNSDLTGGSLQMVAMLRKVFEEPISGAESKGSWDGG